MPAAIIQGATLDNVVQALHDQYGEPNVCGLVRWSDELAMKFALDGPNRVGKCHCRLTPAGLRLTITPYMRPGLLALTILGYLLFIVPGLLITAWIASSWIPTRRILAKDFPEIERRVRTFPVRQPAGSR